MSHVVLRVAEQVDVARWTRDGCMPRIQQECALEQESGGESLCIVDKDVDGPIDHPRFISVVVVVGLRDRDLDHSRALVLDETPDL